MFFGQIAWLCFWNGVGLSVVVLVVTIIFGRLSWVYFEKPLIKTGHRTSHEFGAAGLARAAPAPAEGG